MVMAWGAVERMMKLQEVICRALAGTLTWLQAADILGIQPRSLRRWRARYEAGGQLALYDRRHGPSPRKAPTAEVERVLRLYRERYQGWNVRHFIASPAASMACGCPIASSSSPCRRRAWCARAAPGGAIAGAA